MHTEPHPSNTANYAPRFQVAQNVARKVPMLCNYRNDPFPWIQFPGETIAAVPAKVCIEAWLFQGADDVDIFAGESADLFVQGLQVEAVFICSQFTPAAFEVCVPRDFVGRCQQVVNDGRQGDSRARPLCVTAKRRDVAEHGGAACQEHQAEYPAQVPVELEVAGVQLDGVVDIETGFVVGAAIAHFLFLFGRGLRRRIAVRRNLGFVIFWVNFHEGSLLKVWVLGGIWIVACEPSLFEVCDRESETRIGQGGGL